MFDLLTRPGPDLTTEEREEVKKVARQLLEKVKAAVVLDWRKKAQARARVRLTIEDRLDEGLPRAYTPDLFEQKVSVLFEHVYESYQEEGRSVYNRVASRLLGVARIQRPWHLGAAVEPSWNALAPRRTHPRQAPRPARLFEGLVSDSRNDPGPYRLY